MMVARNECQLTLGKCQNITLYHYRKKTSKAKQGANMSNYSRTVGIGYRFFNFVSILSNSTHIPHVIVQFLTLISI